MARNSDRYTTERVTIFYHKIKTVLPADQLKWKVYYYYYYSDFIFNFQPFALLAVSVLGSLSGGLQSIFEQLLPSL
jgi:hypothetical protein